MRPTNEYDWTEDWQGTRYVFPAVMRRIKQNKLAMKESHEQSHARQVMREQRGREYFEILQEMQMTDPRKVALVPTTETNPSQYQTDALDISLMPTMLIPVVRAPQRSVTTDEIAMIPKRTSPLSDLIDFYRDDDSKWCYVNKTADATHLLEIAIDAYVAHHQTVPAQTLHISSICMLLLAVAQKITITSRDGKSGIYEDERGTFLVRSDAFVNVDTVVFE